MLCHLPLKLKFPIWPITLFLRESILTVVILLDEYKKGIRVTDVTPEF